MTYKQWLDSFAIKHKKIVEKLNNLNLTNDEIIDYFDYDNMKINEPDFCPLYKQNKKCHNMEKLNCYLCGCPYFRVDKRKSSCSIESKFGDIIIAKDGYIHQNCSFCLIPHKKDFIKKVFSKDWAFIMKDTLVY